MYNIVYKTSHNPTGKFYIGVHSTENLDDGYLGSGLLIQKAIVKYGRNEFTRVILFYCESKEEAYDLESILVDENMIKRSDCYNLALGGQGNTGFTPYREINTGKIIGLRVDDPRKISSEFESIFKNTVPVLDTKTNTNIRVSSEEYKDDRYVSLNSGKVAVRDSEGSIFKISVDDNRFLSGEVNVLNKGMVYAILKSTNETVLISCTEYNDRKYLYKHSQDGILTVITDKGDFIRVTVEEFENNRNLYTAATKGKITVVDTNGNSFRVPIDDERIGISLQYAQPFGKVVIDPTSGKNIILQKDDIRLNDKNYISSTTNTVAVKDKNGKSFRISVLDHRYLSGELIPANKGATYSSKGKRRVCKDGKEIYIKPEEIDTYIILGWSTKRKNNGKINK